MKSGYDEPTRENEYMSGTNTGTRKKACYNTALEIKIKALNATRQLYIVKKAKEQRFAIFMVKHIWIYKIMCNSTE